MNNWQPHVEEMDSSHKHNIKEKRQKSHKI